MIWKQWSLIVVAVSLVACGGDPSTDSQKEMSGTHPVDRLITEGFGAEHEPGLALMVVKDGEVIFQRTHGIANMNTGEKITAQSNFRLASVTKHITALAALMLSDWGDLDLDTPLVDLFPGFPAFGKDITPRMLIHHTSGLLEYESLMGAAKDGPLSGDQLMDQVVDADVLELIKTADHTYFESGTEHRYSNTGYALLALLIEQASGMTFPQFLKQNIFDPLGMENTLAYARGGTEVSHRVYGHSKTNNRWVVTDQSRTSAVLGDGGVYCSLEDLKKWIEFLDGNNVLKLSKQAYEDYLSPGVFGDGSKLRVIEPEPTAPNSERLLRSHSYGFGWFFGTFAGIPISYHGGGTIGFGHMFVRKPEEHYFLVLLTNRNIQSGESLNTIIGHFLSPAG